MRTFDLNIEKVLEDWGIQHALREVIANALDEQALTNTSDIDIHKDEQGRWHILDFGRGLKYEHLTQNENSEKLSHPDLVVGKFGVGLKDALATFDRRQIKVFIKSRHGDITIEKSSKHGFSDITTLHAVISDPSEPSIVGTRFSFEGVTDADMAAAKDFFLRFSGDKLIEDTRYGQVLDKGNRTGARIYITGLRVAEEENFLCSYNITRVNATIRRALNRERTNVGRAAYTERVKAILLACKQQPVAELGRQGSQRRDGRVLVSDLQNYKTGTCHDELTWIDVSVHACKLLNESGRVIFVIPDELKDDKDMVDHAEKDSLAVITIPTNVRDKIRGLTDSKGLPLRDLKVYTAEWNESFQYQFVDEKDLTKNERAVFSQTGAIFKLIGGKPPVVKQLRISATMRREASGHCDAVGVWEPDKQQIIIKRDKLKDLRAYAGTLLHETAHATSGASDVSTEFEHELTEFLGTIAKTAL